MDDKLKILQEEGHVVGSAFSEGQSPESTEQEGVTPKSTDVCTRKMGATQDCDNSPEPLMKDQRYRPVSIDSVMLIDEGSPVITLRIQNHFLGEIKYEKVS